MTRTLPTDDSPMIFDVLLRDGGIAQLRLVQPDDHAALDDLNDRVSVRTRMRRYFSTSSRSGEWYVEQVLASGRNGCALVALVSGRIVALASFARLELDPAVADLGLLVDDEHQSAGLGALLLEHLAHLAREQAITAFHADVLLENAPMLHLLADSGFATTSEFAHGVTEVRIDLTDGAKLWEAVHHREARSERASLLPLLAPRTVAVVGSSRHGSVADQVFTAIRGSSPSTGFTGTVHRIDATGRLRDLEPAPDLVVVAVPAARVLDVARDAATAKAKGLLVLSAGFAEEGPDGIRQQHLLLEICRAAGMRLLGPNCLGVVNTDPLVALNATFCDAEPRTGRVALISQSGAVGIAALRHAERAGAGLSLFVSTGNKADVSGNDLLAYLEGDPRTGVIAMYLESFGNARKFARTAATVGKTKPIVVVKAGTSEAGARAGLSHTAAATTPDVAIQALLHRAGVIRADDLPELFDVLRILEATPLPRGPRVAIIGNSGGPGVLAADACASAGLTVAELTGSTQEQLRALLPAGASVDNPVDLLATVSPANYETAVALVAADPGVDAVVAIYTPLSRGAEASYAAALERVRTVAADIPVLTAFPGLAAPPAELEDVPFFEFPEPAVRAMGLVARYAAWRSAPPVEALAPTPSAAVSAAQVLRSAAQGDGWLDPQTTTDLLQAYGIPTVRAILAADADAAVIAAESIGLPVALKAAGPEIVHKSDVGGVRLDLATLDDVRDAFVSMKSHVGPTMASAVVQAMHPVERGLELIAGLTVDASVGPLLMVGAGGTMTDLLDDRLVRMPPDSRKAARDQLLALRCAPQLHGYRGSPPLAIEAAVDALLSLAALARDLPQIRELDLNPLLVSVSGVCALDARIRIGAVPATQPVRALSHPRR